MANEIWTDPAGHKAELIFVRRDIDDWFPEEPGQRIPATYELRSTEGLSNAMFTVTPLEPWSPYDAISDLLIRSGWEPPDEP